MATCTQPGADVHVDTMGIPAGDIFTGIQGLCVRKPQAPAVTCRHKGLPRTLSYFIFIPGLN